MANKTFAEMKKPQRRPSAEEIARFERTGRADQDIREPVDTERRVSVEPPFLETGNPPTQEPALAVSLASASPEAQKPADTEIREPAYTEPAQPADQQMRLSVSTESSEPANTEARVSVPIVRLTIDLPEPDHTRFKIACARRRYRMVDEVRRFIEQRTRELEGASGEPV